MAEHTAVGFAQHLGQLVAFRAFQLDRARGQHACPEVDCQTGHHRDQTDNESYRSEYFTC
ncbi:hypothetical protein D3C80_1263930 [compost metagenome]